MELPRNICRHPDGFLVRIERHGIKRQAFIGGHGPDALARALATRERMLAEAGPAARSNTGISGISETTQWSHNRAYPCFSVTWCNSWKGTKRFTFQRCGGRRQALREAVAFRARKTGERIAEPQIEAALSKV